MKVYTKASRPRVTEEEDGSYRVYVSAAPEKGKANDEVLKALSRHLGLGKTALEIVRGQTARDKLIRLKGP